jgi:hypothetical protein
VGGRDRVGMQRDIGRARPFLVRKGVPTFTHQATNERDRLPTRQFAG